MAALDADQPKRALHCGVGHLQHALRRPFRRLAQCGCQSGERTLDRGSVQLLAAAQEQIGRDPPQPDVGIGHRHLATAERVADGAGHGASALRPHFERAAGIAPSDRAAAGAHGVDIEHRYGDGRAGDLVLLGVDGAARAQGDIGGGPAHVERQHALEPGAPRCLQRGHHSTCRARKDRVYRFPGRPLHRESATSRRHDPHPRRFTLPAQRVQVLVDQRCHVGVYQRRGEALVLPVLGQQPARARDRYPEPGQSFSHRVLVSRVRVAVQKADGHRIRTIQPLSQRRQLLSDQWTLLRAVVEDAAADPDAILGGHQRRRPLGDQGVQLGPILPADLDEILEATVGDPRSPSTSTLQQRVGGYRGPMGQHKLLPRPQEFP